MLRPLFRTALLAVLIFSLGPVMPLRAQVGPGLSSGSGQGTGTGASSAIQGNRSGSSSGIGPGSSSGLRGPADNALPSGRMPPTNMGVPLGPGVNTSFPDDTTVFPNGMMPDGRGGNSNVASTVDPSLFDAVRRIGTPDDRSLALQKLANAAIFSNQLDMAHTALVEASQSALQVSKELVHDQRLIAIITSYMTLAEAHLREGKVDMSLPE